MVNAPSPAGTARRPRDLRLDFFRGLAMFLILAAHTPNNTWTLWLPARFGFSDAADIFVFCSGMASALAFGAIFSNAGWRLGTARIAYRIWQIYWAHIGLFIVSAALLFAVDYYGVGKPGLRYITAPYIVPFFENTGEALTGLLTLGYVPNYFDILPMYMGILAMIPLMMLIHRHAGFQGVAAAVIGIWFCANLAAYAALADPARDYSLIQRLAINLGGYFDWMNLPSRPWKPEIPWFFNPFGWQLLFFTGFSFGMGWLPAPPVTRRLIWAAVAVVLVTLPLAWFKIHQAQYMPDEWWLHDQIYYLREWIAPLRGKTEYGLWRYVHFLALAYLAWVLVGPGGERLRSGFGAAARLPKSRRQYVGALAALIAVLTVPYAYTYEIKWLAPGVDRWMLENWPLLPENRIGMAQLVHLGALMVLFWQAAGDHLRTYIKRDSLPAMVPVIRKVGTQSLAVFLVSMVMARFDGLLIDRLQEPQFWGEKDVWLIGAVNIFGFGVLIMTAYFVGWIKSQPWRVARPATKTSSQTSGQKETGVSSAPIGIRSF